MEVLKRYRWRGNIRELRNTIERMIIMTEGDAIDVADLPEAVKSDKGRAASRRGRRAARRPRRPARMRARCANSRNRPSGRGWSKSCAKTRWNISKTAEVIGTPRSNLYKKLEQYAIRQETDG